MENIGPDELVTSWFYCHGECGFKSLTPVRHLAKEDKLPLEKHTLPKNWKTVNGIVYCGVCAAKREKPRETGGV